MTQTTTSTRLRPFKPTPFGRYTLLLPVSTGGMGEIFLARVEGARGFEKLCVIKRILPQFAQDKEFVTRFVNEAKTLAQLSHGSIAQIQDFGMVDGTPFLAMEYVDGKDLRRIAARMRDRNLPMPLTFVLYVMGRVLDALAYAHRKRDEDENEIGLVHRDVSPQNVLISYEGEVKVIDFGLAKSTLVNSNTQPSIVLGKFLYMSPEQAKHQQVDRRSDLYSVGLCIYELIAGKNPFDEIPPGELMHKVAAPTIRPLNQAEPLTPPAVAQVVMRALNPDPALRFQTAEEFRGRLMACLMDIDPSAGPESASRFMRDIYSVEHAAEKKLHASIREQMKAAEEADAAVRLVVPPAGRPVLEPVAPRREVSPLSFKPTPTSRALNTDFSDKDRETMPGVMPPEGFNRVGEAETAQVGVVSEPAPPRGRAPPPVARAIEATEPSGVGLQPVAPRPRASAPAPAPVPPSLHGQAQTLPSLPQVPGLTVPFNDTVEIVHETTDPSLAPVSGPPNKGREVTKPVASVVVAPALLGSPLDTLPPSGPHAMLGTPIEAEPTSTDNKAAGPLPDPVPEAGSDEHARPTSTEGKAQQPEKPARSTDKDAMPVRIDTQPNQKAVGRPSMLIILVPLLAVLGAGAFVGYDLWLDAKKAAQTKKPDEKPDIVPPMPAPTPVKQQTEEVAPPPAPAVKEENKADDDEISPLQAETPAPVKKEKASGAPKRSARVQTRADRSWQELEKAYTDLTNEGLPVNKFKARYGMMRSKYSPTMSEREQEKFAGEADKLREDIEKASGEAVR